MRTAAPSDTPLACAENHVAQERCALASPIERSTAAPERPERQRVILPVSKADGGVQPGVELDSNAALLDLLDEQ